MTQINPHSRVNKLDLLLKSGQKLFHTQDLSLLWKMTNRNTLYTAIKRLVKKGVLITVRKGLYSVLPVSEIDKIRLGPALIHRYCYLSTETVLAEEGIIFQKVYPITFVSAVSEKIEIADSTYLFRKLKEKCLFSFEGINKEGELFIAEKARAVADILYFNPSYHFDNRLDIDWDRVKEIRKKVGY